MDGDAFVAVIAALSGLSGAAAGGFATYVVARHRAGAADSAAAQQRAWVAEVQEHVAVFLSLDVLIELYMSQSAALYRTAEEQYNDWVMATGRHKSARHRLLSLLDPEDPAHRALIEAAHRVANAWGVEGGERSAALRLELARCAHDLLGGEDTWYW